ncbi:Uma2 family endonuclease [Streptomyces sp. ME01-24h]|nr:Uma2 family endonuclease [Streptomyces sp. ME19-03-3]MDX3354398.1 Uma2 family endonuclease [Streptomyces sp. ME01-24h]
MTAVDDRRMTDFFENLRVPEGVKVELLRGEIVMMAGPDLVHNDIIDAVIDQFPRTRWRRLQTQDLAIPEEASEPQPDLVILERGAGPSSGRLLPSEAVTLVVEVVSRTSAHRDHVVKRSIYAAGKVPVYLIIDPLAAECVVLTEPVGTGDQADYRAERTWKFGETVRLPVVDVALDTSEFQVLPGLTPGS